MDYHPGGWDELMKGAGIDATDLFNEVHRWVNYESMLQVRRDSSSFYERHL